MQLLDAAAAALFLAAVPLLAKNIEWKWRLSRFDLKIRDLRPWAFVIKDSGSGFSVFPDEISRFWVFSPTTVYKRLICFCGTVLGKNPPNDTEEQVRKNERKKEIECSTRARTGRDEKDLIAPRALLGGSDLQNTPLLRNPPQKGARVCVTYVCVVIGRWVGAPLLKGRHTHNVLVRPIKSFEPGGGKVKGKAALYELSRALLWR